MKLLLHLMLLPSLLYFINNSYAQNFDFNLVDKSSSNATSVVVLGPLGSESKMLAEKYCYQFSKKAKFIIASSGYFYNGYFSPGSDVSGDDKYAIEIYNKNPSAGSSPYKSIYSCIVTSDDELRIIANKYKENSSGAKIPESGTNSIAKIRAEAEEAKRKQTELEQQLRLAQNQPVPPLVSSVQQPGIPPFIGKRLALVIGNASYKVRPLLNPRNDADDVSKVLRSTGFEVIDLRDATLAQMRTSVRQFGERLMSNDVGLVYYSGHGIEVKGRNYFIPVNADIKASDEVADQALDVSLILAKMDTAKKGVNILIVDACRDDPFGRSFRSNSRGLATMDAPQGTLIAYATAPGSVAADGTGRNSPFTKHLVRAMQVPNTPIELMFKEVRRAVREETKNQQTPWENSSLIGNFYFSVKK